MGSNSYLKRACLITILAILCLLGLWNTGQGAWIYVKAELSQYLLEAAWTKTLRGSKHAIPWPWADTWPIARLLIPQHDMNLFVLSGASGRTLAFGPGHVSGSAVPGEIGTTILNGHRDTHFKILEYLRLDDQIVLELPNGKRKQYSIDEVKIVNASSAKIFHDDTTSRLVLITCYPFDAIMPGGPLRYVVSAVLSTSSA